MYPNLIDSNNSINTIPFIFYNSLNVVFYFLGKR